MRLAAKSLASLVVFGSLAAASPPAWSAAYKYTTISNSQSPSDEIYPVRVNDSNLVVGQYIKAGSSRTEGFVWQNGNIEISSNVAFFAGINDDGIAAGASGNLKGGPEISLYNVAANTYQTSRLGLAGTIDGLDINVGGVVVGETSDVKGRKLRAFLFSDGEPHRLHPQKHENCGAASLNDNGDVVGTCDNNKTGYLYSGGKYTVLAVPNASYFVLNFITNDGVMGGGALIGSAYVGFSYSGGVYTYYTPTVQNFGQGGALVGALANSNFVGNYSDSAGSSHGYLYSAAENEYYQLDYPGAVYTNVTGVSSAGSLIGVYQETVNGPFLAFVATCSAKQGCNQVKAFAPRGPRAFGLGRLVWLRWGMTLRCLALRVYVSLCNSVQALNLDCASPETGDARCRQIPCFIGRFRVSRGCQPAGPVSGV